MGNSCSSCSSSKSKKDVAEHRARAKSLKEANLNKSKDEGWTAEKQGKMSLIRCVHHAGVGDFAEDVSCEGKDPAPPRSDLGVIPEEEDPEKEREKDEDAYEEISALVRLLALLKMSAVSLVSVAATFYLTRRFVAPEFSERMVMASMDFPIEGRWVRKCTDCSMKSLNTIPIDIVQQHASEAAIKGSEWIHKAYLAAEDFTPPRIYHNFWAARDFPNNYYSQSPTIKNYRFTRIFGW